MWESTLRSASQGELYPFLYPFFWAHLLVQEQVCLKCLIAWCLDCSGYVPEVQCLRCRLDGDQKGCKCQHRFEVGHFLFQQGICQQQFRKIRHGAFFKYVGEVWEGVGPFYVHGGCPCFIQKGVIRSPLFAGEGAIFLDETRNMSHEVGAVTIDTLNRGSRPVISNFVCEVQCDRFRYWNSPFSVSHCKAKRETIWISCASADWSL